MIRTYRANIRSQVHVGCVCSVGSSSIGGVWTCGDWEEGGGAGGVTSAGVGSREADGMWTDGDWEEGNEATILWLCRSYWYLDREGATSARDGAKGMTSDGVRSKEAGGIWAGGDWEEGDVVTVSRL